VTEGDPRATMNESVPPGGTFGRYEIVRMIGAGGMGNVYEARHVELDKRVALKVLSRRLAKNSVYLERFLREGRVAAKLDHAHVVDVFDVGTHEGSPFLVMEFLVGRDLEVHLKEEGSLDAAPAVDILLPILSALMAAHRVGLIHRDLKPANIFLATAAHGGFHPKLLDFGIAKPHNEDQKALTGTADVFGTPQYMAPEQVRKSRDADARSDQYSMGAVLYRALAGCEAYELDDASMFELLERVVAGSFPKPSSIRRDIPEQLEGIVLRAMARLPEDRFQSIQEFGAALLPFASASSRNTWSPLFATADASAETLAPPVGSHPDMTPTVVPSEEVSAPHTDSGGTMAASSHDARPSIGTNTSTRPASRRLIYIGVGAGVALSAATTWFMRDTPPRVTDSTASASIAVESSPRLPSTSAEEPSSTSPKIAPSPSGSPSTSGAPSSSPPVETSSVTKPSVPVLPRASAAPSASVAPSVSATPTTPQPSSTRYRID
jgi:eukaryotic-like serine/threonine-protein kinase